MVSIVSSYLCKCELLVLVFGQEGMGTTHTLLPTSQGEARVGPVTALGKVMLPHQGCRVVITHSITLPKMKGGKECGKDRQQSRTIIRPFT